MTRLAALFALLGTAVAAAEPSLLVASTKGLMHVQADGTLLSWRPEPFQWWQADHVAANPRNGTACWVSADENQSVDAVVRCARVDSLNETWDLPQPRHMRVNKADAIELDWVTNNWHLTESRVNYVCSYLFDQCVQVGKSSGNVRFYAAYDLPGRLMFLVTTIGFEMPYRLEVARLDGSERRILPAELDYPLGLAVDAADGRVYWLDRIDGWDMGVYRVDYEGNGKELLAKLDHSIVQSHDVSIDIVGDSVFVMWDDQKRVSSISKSTGERTDLDLGKAADASQLELRDFGKLLTVRVYAAETQPPAENLCREANGGCAELCVPTVVNGSASRTCFCPPGEQIHDTVCQKTYPAHALIVRSDSVQAVDLASEEVTTILSGLTNASKVDFFWAGGAEYELFWLDDGGLYRGRWSSAGPVTAAETLMEPAADPSVVELAVIAPLRLLLWIERHEPESRYSSPGMEIKVANLDGSSRKTIVSDRFRTPKSLVVLDEGRNFAFSEVRYGDLEVSMYSLVGKSVYFGFGSQVKPMLANQPNDFAASPSTIGVSSYNRFFWIDSKAGSIEYMHFDSGFSAHHDRLLTDPSLATAGGLDVLGARIFWTDAATGRLLTADSETGGGVRAVNGTAGADARAVRLLHPWKQPAATRDTCDEQRSGCSDLCLVVLKNWRPTVKCACADGRELGEDGKTCQ